MRKFVLIAAVFVVLAGCGDLSGPKDAVSLGQVNGLWVLPLTKTANCSSYGSPNVVTVYLQLSVPAGGGNVSNTKWGFGSNAIDRNATGNVSLATGELTQVLFHYDPKAASRLTGTIAASGTFTGTFIDPAPGREPQITLVGCEYSASGSKQ